MEAKKLVFLLLAVGICSVASGGLIEFRGIPEEVDTSGGDVRIIFDIVSNGLPNNSILDIYATTGATLDISTAMNVIRPGDMSDSPSNRIALADNFGIDISDVGDPVIRASVDVGASVVTPCVGIC